MSRYYVKPYSALEAAVIRISLAAGAAIGLAFAGLSAYLNILHGFDILGIAGMVISWVCTVAFLNIILSDMQSSWIARAALTVTITFLLASICSVLKFNYVGLWFYWCAFLLTLLYLAVVLICLAVAKVVRRIHGDV